MDRRRRPAAAVGRLIHQGGGGHGYALCLRCGRAAPEVGHNAGSLPVPFEKNGSHLRLRGGRDKNQAGNVCDGAGYAIRRNLWLGGEERTDVAELLLRPREGGMSPDEALRAASSLAVALRTALARRIGVDPREVGWAVREGAGDADGRMPHTIALYDTAAGGAGYAGRLPEELPVLLADARRVLECPLECDAACHACLLGHDTQRAADRLDRHAGLRLVETEALAGLSLPEQFRHFGDETKYEPRPMLAVLAEAVREGAGRLRLWMDPPATPFRVGEFPAGRQLQRAAADGAAVEVVLTAAPDGEEAESLARPLARWLESVGGTLGVGEPQDGVTPLLEVGRGGAWTRWAACGGANRTAGDAWGNATEDAPLVRGPAEIPWPTRAVSPDAFDPPPPTVGATVVRLDNSLDGPVDGFGTRFWKLVRDRGGPAVAAMLDDFGGVSSVRYSDRYLKSPLAVRLLAEVVRKPVVEAGADPAAVAVVVETLPADNFGRAMSVWDDFRNVDDQEAVIRGLLHPDPRRVEVDTDWNRQRRMQHWRELSLSWPDDRGLTIRLDQGFGAWSARAGRGGSGGTELSFSAGGDRMARTLRYKSFDVALDEAQRGSPLTIESNL